MRVSIYRDDNGEQTLEAQDVPIWDALGDMDTEEAETVRAELKRAGRCWIGGGAHPVFILYAQRQ